MPGRPYVLAEATWKTVKDTPYEVAILPWGATEAHNYHLPYGTDVIECDRVAAESARIAWEAGARLQLADHLPEVVPPVPVEDHELADSLPLEREHEVGEQRRLRARIHVQAQLDVELSRVHAKGNSR